MVCVEHDGAGADTQQPIIIIKATTLHKIDSIGSAWTTGYAATDRGGPHTNPVFHVLIGV